MRHTLSPHSRSETQSMIGLWMHGVCVNLIRRGWALKIHHLIREMNRKVTIIINGLKHMGLKDQT